MSSVELSLRSFSNGDNSYPQATKSSIGSDGELPTLLRKHISNGLRLKLLDDQQDPPKNVRSKSLSDQQEQTVCESFISDKHPDSIHNHQKFSDGTSREAYKKLPDSQQESLPITEKTVNNVSFHDIEYTVKSHVKKEKKTILHSVRLD